MSQLATALDLIAAGLRAQGLAVRIGAPTGEEDLALWPWQLVLAPTLRATAAQAQAQLQSPPNQHGLELRFLLVCKDAQSAVATLQAAHSFLEQTPVLQADDTFFQVHSTSLAPEVLAAVFMAAGVKLTLSSGYVLRSASWSPTQRVA